MATNDDPARFTLDALTEPNEVPILGLAASDFWAITAPAAAGILLTALLRLGLAGVALTVFLMIAGGVLVYVAPGYLNVKEWLHTVWYYTKQPIEVNNIASPGKASDDSLLEQAQATHSTSEFTKVRRFYQETKAVERTDGRLAGAIKIEPPNMDFATPDDWVRVMAACEEWANKSLEPDFEIQLYVTTRSFPIEDYIENLQQRLGDEDVRENPVFEAMIQETIQQRPQQIKDAGTELPHFYMIVDVGEGDIANPAGGDKSPLQKLADVPILGIPVELFTSLRGGVTERKQRAQMGTQLERKLQRIESNLIQGIEGYESRRVPVHEWAAMLRHFWEGEEPEFSADDQQIRTQPAVTGASGETDA